MKKEEILKKIEDYGVVGSGGAGFPTHIKYRTKAETVIVNLAECEPLLRVDQQLAERYGEDLVEGLECAMTAVDAGEGIIALKEKYRKAVQKLEPLLNDRMRIFYLRDVYPAGDEFITIKMATGKSVPPASIPISIGVVVSNAQTLINVARAMKGQPVVTRTITVTGNVKNPVTVTVPIGISYRQLLEMTGNDISGEDAYIDGGPFMGKMLTDLDSTVTKTSGGLVVLPKDHVLVKIKTQPMSHILRVARTVCEQCQLCTDLCPRNIIGHRDLKPHMSIRAVNYGKMTQSQTIKGAILCSDCGVCELYSCPVNISPRRVNQAIKQELVSLGIKYEGVLSNEDPLWNARLVPSRQIANRAGLKNYYHLDAPLLEDLPDVHKVRINLKQHVGVPSEPVVLPGDPVKKGDLIARIKKGQLGANLHASIDGVVSKINDKEITIEKGGEEEWK
ncbi:4Fe-4S dicluster domain-containing protein [Sinanaerobacter chloroacetimidivorans]|uniref:4Fe-4S dicluster domain-containing protein n=1 Tax=Sinanaerobacter chloroacetimidivorans TaxID=2818044 RepID=A0A8J7W6L9_9FIRM|nr:4Fe-4S dicluster domain-containing protein [Sinanaerobacter chloroacetimidivorans]MBR0599885.1 4Fe-4S dicluster domain-containing protein [Sinanaerobacter chloroacetimidivorans]